MSSVAPETLGRYTLVEKIGEGGTGEVFKAHDPQLDRFVAIKIIRSADSRSSLVRFQREGASVANLRHPNIVDIFELGDEDGKLFLVLELLEGIDLKLIIDAKVPLSLPQKLRLLEQMYDAVGFMHQKGVVHRDLKPANIHILPDGRVKIIDFGLVRLASSNLTVAGAVLGTPYYMSPEQIQGKPASASADVFSLGAIAYELLSYRKPFRSPSLFSVHAEIAHKEHEPLSALVSGLPEDLVAMVDRALSKQPEGRFKDATQMCEAIRTVRTSDDVVLLGYECDQFAPITSFDRESILEKTFTEISDDNLAPETDPLAASRGHLTLDDLPSLLQTCSTSHKTGTLRAHNGIIEKAFVIENGHLTSSDSNSPRETLGQFLVSFGYITEEELMEALLQQERDYVRLDRFLLAQGVADEPTLQSVYEFQAKERLYDCFLWREGGLDFEEGQVPAGTLRAMSLELEPILREGIRRARRWRSIRRVIPTALTKFASLETAVDETTLCETDRRILDLVAKGMSLAEIAIQMRVVEYDAASRLFDLCERQVIKVDEVSVELPREQQVKDFRGRLNEGLDRFMEGNHLEALFAFEAAVQIEPEDKAYQFVERALRVARESRSLDDSLLEAVPRLAASFDKLSEKEADPIEAFILSRINGHWNVRSILKICPVSEQHVLLVLQRFLQEGVIELVVPDSKV